MILIKESAVIMEELYLRVPTIEDKESILDYKEEFETCNDYLAGTGSINLFNNFEEWFQKFKNDLSIETCGEGRVPATQYLTFRKSDNKLVGMIQIRHSLNDYLLKFGGHIGDSVRPTERNKGYATEQIRLALLECKKLGLHKVLITCNKNNLASARTIVKNGGVLENELEKSEQEIFQRYWIEI